MVSQLTWEQFLVVNNDAYGCQRKFEDLCRQLFANEFLSNNRKRSFIHSNPNNPGIEAEPVFDETNNERISYQAKFFNTRPQYNQILNSAKQTVEYYADKVDVVYLYCNKQLSTTSTIYIQAQQILKDNGIELRPITSDAILDQVRKYPYLAFYYFGNHRISYDWFCNHNKSMLIGLGERFNDEFNVNTHSSLYLSYFSQDESAINSINERKKKLLLRIKELQSDWQYREFQSYLKALESSVCALENITYDNIEDSFVWLDKVLDDTKSYISDLEEAASKLDEKRNELLELQEKDRKVYENIANLDREIEKLEELIALPQHIELSECERNLISGKILVITGDAGTGKSQLFANETSSLMKKDRNALLLLSDSFLTDDPIQEQIMKNCSLDFELDELFNILETTGELQRRIVPIFIDALNETWNKKVWEAGLPRLIAAVQKYRYVKLAVSYRGEYEKQLLAPALIKQIETGDICHISHHGFYDNSIHATEQFLNHYGIPFSPSEFLEPEMVNPLFLTLYCRTYDGKRVDLPSLYEKLLSNANENLHSTMILSLRQKGYTGSEDIVSPLVMELADWLVSNDARRIPKEELVKLSFWTEYGITAPPFLAQLVQEHILYNHVFEENEYWYFSYDQMNDYFCAKAILRNARSPEEARIKLSNDVLKIADGEVAYYGNRDLFIHACVFYREKFGKECIDLIDKIDDQYERNDLFNRYIQSFGWRNVSLMTPKEFMELLRSRPINPQALWKMLIGNSVKVDHILNADFLHELLITYNLNKRDYLWTQYINTIFIDEANRITQLVQMYNTGATIPIALQKQIELLITLFGWLLASSDRQLRDCTSKAMVEILKNDFSLCEVLLKKFESVNDPYVLQRLYGVVFGACCKRLDSLDEVYCSLAEYVYTTIFDQGEVYPDILLRDYARLIIERFLWEYPSYSGKIDRDKITPPYRSAPIPKVNDDFTKMNFNGGLYRICASMRFENMGMYGDFGRYVFQSALRNFVVDHTQIFNYAMWFIINTLGYKEELFGEFDQFCERHSFDRHNTAKVERIGKKYQWIAMYNILARVSDHCEVREPYSFEEDEKLIYAGPWNPYVRDFDPTLNSNSMTYKSAPTFPQIDKYIYDTHSEIDPSITKNMQMQKEWLEQEGPFLEDTKDLLILTDENDVQWVWLKNHLDTGRGDLRAGGLLVWRWTYPYFVTPEQMTFFAQCAKKHIAIRSDDLFRHNETYTIFSREYPWSPACKPFNESAWVDAGISTGEKETIVETLPIELVSLLNAYNLVDKEGIANNLQDVFDNDDNKRTIVRDVQKDIGKILCASSDILWEEEYDASKQGTISYGVPCAELIERLSLRQLQSDGFYFDEKGKLAAFDMGLVQKNTGVVIRKDLLDQFLDKSGLRLIWLVQASKEIHASDLHISHWSDWEAVLTYEGEQVKGEFFNTQLMMPLNTETMP